MATKVKPVSAPMLKALKDAAAKVSIHAPSVAAGAGKAFEALVLMEVAARFATKYSVEARDHTGSPTLHFRVAGGPSLMPAQSSTNPSAPCHFLVGNRFELHSSLRHQGRSGDSPEIDVSLVCAYAANHVRAGNIPSAYRGDVFVGIELKEYDPNESLPKHYARAFLGLAIDLTPQMVIGSVEVTIRGITYDTWPEPWDPPTRYVLATTTTLTPLTKTLLNHYSIGWHENVLPANVDEVVDAALGNFF
jgi:hypothetical protein